MAGLRVRRLRVHAPWLAALVVTLVGGSYYAVASGVTSRSDKKIYACVTADYKTLNLSLAHRRCPSGQHKISWNAEGRRGATGKRGAKGAVGPAGVKGDAGGVGAIGAAGPAGAVGPAGVQGDAGVAGPIGPEGSAGPAGSDGTNGRDAPADYGHIYNQSAQTVPVDADVTFDGNGVLTSSITHKEGGSAVTIGAAGTYDVSYLLVETQVNEFALMVNGVAVPGGEVAGGADGQTAIGRVFVQLKVDDVLTVRNSGSRSSIVLSTGVGGSKETVNAALTIQRLPDAS